MECKLITNKNVGERADSSSKAKVEQSFNEDEDEDLKNVVLYFKSYSIQDMDIFCEKAKRIVDTYDDGVYEGSLKVKELNLVESREVLKPIFVSVDLMTKEEDLESFSRIIRIVLPSHMRI